jgi:hypothetical protein
MPIIVPSENMASLFWRAPTRGRRREESDLRPEEDPPHVGGNLFLSHLSVWSYILPDDDKWDLRKNNQSQC